MLCVIKLQLIRVDDNQFDRQMKKQDALKIPELCIEVSPAVEDAFYFLLPVNWDDMESTDASTHAGQRLISTHKDMSWEAVKTAYKMIDNIEKYGVACAEWCDD